jgi:CRISPR-associated protein Cas2
MAKRRTKKKPTRGTYPRHQFIVVSYDIPDDRRRTKVCHLLKDYGERVQYSVFECRLRPRDFGRLRERLKPLLEPKEDDVRFYRLCGACLPQALVWGSKQRQPLPEAVVV